MICINELEGKLLGAFVAGKLSDEEKALFQKHLEKCESCSVELFLKTDFKVLFQKADAETLSKPYLELTKEYLEQGKNLDMAGDLLQDAIKLDSNNLEAHELLQKHKEQFNKKDAPMAIGGRTIFDVLKEMWLSVAIFCSAFLSFLGYAIWQSDNKLFMAIFLFGLICLVMLAGLIAKISEPRLKDILLHIADVPFNQKTKDQIDIIEFQGNILKSIVDKLMIVGGVIKIGDQPAFIYPKENKYYFDKSTIKRLEKDAKAEKVYSLAKRIESTERIFNGQLLLPIDLEGEYVGFIFLFNSKNIKKKIAEHLQDLENEKLDDGIANILERHEDTRFNELLEKIDKIDDLVSIGEVKRGKYIKEASMELKESVKAIGCIFKTVQGDAAIFPDEFKEILTQNAEKEIEAIARKGEIAILQDSNVVLYENSPTSIIIVPVIMNANNKYLGYFALVREEEFTKKDEKLLDRIENMKIDNTLYALQ